MAEFEPERARGHDPEAEARRDATDRASRRAREIGLDLSQRKRGDLDLARDRSQHRRFAWLYDDLLT